MTSTRGGTGMAYNRDRLDKIAAHFPAALDALPTSIDPMRIPEIVDDFDASAPRE